MTLDAFFFDTVGQERLFGVWRSPSTPAQMVWVVCPPFAEEEKSCRRTLTELAGHLLAQGEASLIFSWRGMGDSSGDFATTDLELWRHDLRAAVAVALERAPGAPLGLLGVRLGASLALAECALIKPARMVAIEPLMSGRSFLMQQNARKKMRAQLTQADQPAGIEAPEPTATATSPRPTSSASPPEACEDLDGWPLGADLRRDLLALDLRGAPPLKSEPTRCQVVQVGPRSEVAGPLQALAQGLGAQAQVCVMPAFWNLLDYTPADPLFPLLEATAA